MNNTRPRLDRYQPDTASLQMFHLIEVSMSMVCFLISTFIATL